jgi:RNA polymerase sigma factor (sigma-70 family)
MRSLVLGLQHGDDRAVAEVVQQIVRDREERRPHSETLLAICGAFRPRIFAFLRKEFFGKDEPTVEEVWNDTLERVYAGVERYDRSKAKFSTWLFNQARYVALDQIRALERYRRFEDLPGDVRPVAPHIDPLESVLREFDEVALRRAFLGLPGPEQKLLFLKHVLGCRHVEIGRNRLAEHVPEDHVRIYVNRISEKLRRLYQEVLAGEGFGVPTQVDALPLDEIWSIERVVAEVVAAGDLDHVACLQADIDAARIGHGLREAFEPGIARDWFDGDLRREFDDLCRETPREELHALSDEEVEGRLTTLPT